MKKKVVLAYSGGLDTTYCALYLSKTLGYEVHAVTVNTGGFTAEEIQTIEQKALSLGIASYRCVDSVVEYYESCVKYLLFGNVLKNNTYPLSVSAERTIQAKVIAEYALEVGAEAICHGSTGAGNDQVRFDVVFNILAPQMEIITPIRDLKLSREEEIDFLKEHGVDMNFEKAKYSINKGLWGTSVGGKETLTSHEYLPEDAFPSQVKKTEQEQHTLLFDNGELVGIDGEIYNHPTKAIKKLEELAAPFGIGRDIHVGDTIIGIKGRVGFEAASALIALKAHHLLEKHTLSKNQLVVKDQLAVMYGNWLHEAMFLDPVMRNIEAFFKNSQTSVSGKVFVTFMPYRFVLNGIESQFDLMSGKFGQYGEMNNAWTGDDVKGFSKILANSLTIYHKTNPGYGK
ncbi:argininosuccinate synthase [Elizabethkingia anophelis]|nr:argininosuccinate synthase [Elizabethkingia anophelis]MCT3801466.1 argininosuccinate synthase [Elizabethkingia anophelis]MCT3923570.1 argininosuccinate synthase [Elizabethkingia anophelis]MCT4058379.1 argininosuccinate synthase [Elizabethkingia anophelis]MCT4062974.1 argininosuccinate synthase [Elizabethkingia anophelis]